eukprot:CAMPEP_0197466700 /NCGR_PEP_ID=MMETSP1175-20131217/65187_1 /TAXON_ID=1003142 /ORGANISM="Triceratium dubium, Strain CCMP147" /LENGTH=950 /DNA_ID=CAMNT_0043002749 /DNA_START=1093 /DNA_END=3945 /DNA_ORIENTATION=-
MAGNMESMLMGRSDSSSDDDSGDEAVFVGTLGSAAAAVAASLPKPAPAPAPAASAPPPPQPDAPALKPAPAAPAPAAAPPGAAPVATPRSAPAPPPAAATTPPRVAAVTATVTQAPPAQQLRQAAANNPSTAAPTAPPPGANPSEVSRRLKAASGQALMAMPSAATPATTAPPPKPAGVPTLPPMPTSVRPGRAPPGASQPAAQPGVINPSAAGRPVQQQQREEQRRQAARRAAGLPSSLPPPGGAVAPQQQQMSTATAVPAAAAGRGAQHHSAPGGQQLAAAVPRHLQQKQPQPVDTNRAHEAKREEKLFLTLVLMKYLEKKDSAMHSKAKAVIKECEERKKAGDAAYASLTNIMQTRLRQTVGEAHWKKAEDYLNHFLKQKLKQREQQQAKQHTEDVQRQATAAQQAQIDAQAKARAVAVEQQQRVTVPSTVAAQMQQQQQPQFQRQQASASSPSFSSVMKTAKSMSAKQIAHKEKQKAQKAVATRRPMQNSADANSAAASTTPAGDPALSATTAAAMPPATTTKKTQKKQTKKVPKAASAAAKAAATAKAKEDEPPKEYAELMEMVDHATRYDWSSAALLLGKEYKSEVNLAEEQRRLLYGEGGAGALGRPGAAQAATAIVTSASVSESAAAAPRTEFERHATATKAAAGLPPTQSQPSNKLPPAARGWDKRNVLSVRAAWAKLRLPEREALHLSGGTGRSGPTAGLRPLPGAAAAQQPKTNKPSLVPQAQPPCETEWFNEDRAKEDKSLALLSEATELYLKSVLEGAVSSARRRQNLDGVRLWHRQHVTNGDKSGGTSSLSTAALSASGGQPPEGSAPLCLRLGCDVHRQAALAEGNAAKTVQRMEEALSRSKDLDAAGRNLRDDETLYGAESMADLAQRPRLARASMTADRDAKRKFEVFGGKGSGAPPFGRVPKKVLILAKDLRPCLEDPSFPVRRLCVPRSIF